MCVIQSSFCWLRFAGFEFVAEFGGDFDGLDSVVGGGEAADGGDVAGGEFFAVFAEIEAVLNRLPANFFHSDINIQHVFKAGGAVIFTLDSNTRKPDFHSIKYHID